jgi:iron complex outermembrane receptor protein
VFLLAGLAAAGPPSAADANAAGAKAPSTAPASRPAAADPVGGELLLFADVPMVVSAGRSAQPMNWLSVPVSVITAEDIHYGGLTNLPEILQFSPGIDMVQHSRNLYSVGVRGMHYAHSERLLSMVDGRVADSPLYGGPQLLELPLMMEDIKRVEIVRGPGGSAWGANAYTGAVNIITKEPEETQGWLASTTWSQWGDSYNHVRWGSKEGNWAWRTSVGYKSEVTSDQAMGGDASFTTTQPMLAGPMGLADYRTHDYTRQPMLDAVAAWTPDNATRLKLGAAYSHLETGDYEQVGYWPRDNWRSDYLRLFARLEKNPSPDTSYHFQWYGNYWDAGYGKGRLRYYENDWETQYNFKACENHSMSVGGNFRWLHAQMGWDDNPQTPQFPGQPYDEYTMGAFVIDRWDLTKRWTLEGQFRLDWYSESQVDWSGRVSSLYSLDDAKRHVVRVSAAKAYRTPLVTSRELEMKRLFLGSYPGMGDIYAVDYGAAVEKLRNEETFTIEAGYEGRMTNWLTFKADAFVQKFDDIFISTVGTRSPIPTSYYYFHNSNSAMTYGGETELEFHDKRGKLSLWYAYCGFAEGDGPDVRSLHPAEHKGGVTGRLFLPDNWTLNAAYKVQTITPCNTPPRPMVSRLDLTVSKAFMNKQAEVMFGVTDVLDTTNSPAPGLEQFSGQELPGRTFFERLQYRF